MFAETTGYRTRNVTFFNENYLEVVTYPNCLDRRWPERRDVREDL